MTSTDSYDEAVANLYRAAGGDMSWTDALTGIVELFGAWAVVLMGFRLADQGLALSHEGGPGMTPERSMDYLMRYHRIDPRAQLVMPMPIGQWMHCHEHFDEAFVARDPFYQEFLLAYGGRYVSGAKVYQDDELLAIFGMHRGRGSQPLNEDERELAQRLGQHLQVALGIRRRQAPTMKHAATGQAVLARLSQPALLVDENLQLHFHNDAARDLFDRNKLLQTRRGLLVSARIEDQRALARSVRELGSRVAMSGAADDRVTLRLGIGADARNTLLLTVSPLLPAETMSAFGSRNLALVLVQELFGQRRHDPYLVASVYRLTPAEAQVAARVAGGESPKQIATALSVSVHTVRAQLGAVFEKVGVRRQAELAAALSGMLV